MAFDPDVWDLLGIAGRVPPETFLRERMDNRQDVYVRGKLIGDFSWTEAFRGRVSVDLTVGSERLTLAPAP